MSAPHPAAIAAPPPTERSCYTCAFSPPPGGIAGCYALTGRERADMPIIDYCEASGANAHDGWPVDRSLACPRWVSR